METIGAIETIVQRLEATPRSVLFVTGAGIEPLDDLRVNDAHRLCDRVSLMGGGVVTLNVSGLQTLECTERHVAIHGTILDQITKTSALRPRTRHEAVHRELLPDQRGTRISISTGGSVKDMSRASKLDADEARVTAGGKELLVLMGTSLYTGTSGGALRFLEVCEARDAIFVNIDSSMNEEYVETTLQGYGMRKVARVTCVHACAIAFAKQVMARYPECGRECGRESHFDLPVKFPPIQQLGAVADHKFGLQRVAIRELFERVQANMNRGAHKRVHTAQDDAGRKRKPKICGTPTGDGAYCTLQLGHLGQCERMEFSGSR